MARTPQARIDFKRLPDELHCVVLRSIDVTDLDGKPIRDRFTAVPAALALFIGQCAGAQGVAQIASVATQTVLANGWVTTRVIVPDQNVASGHLTLQLIPGTVGLPSNACG